MVFAEDVSEVQSTDAVSSESIYFFQCVGGNDELFKLLGLTCAPNMKALSVGLAMRLEEHEVVTKETISMIAHSPL